MDYGMVRLQAWLGWLQERMRETVSKDSTPGEFYCGNGMITRQSCGDKAVSFF